MNRTIRACALAGATALGSAAHAQMPAPPMGGGQRPMGGPGAASMLLSHTGDLKLTDAQVTRLAAVARKTADRHTAARASADSMRTVMMRPQAAAPSAPPGGRPQAPTNAMRSSMEAMRTSMEKTRQAEHDDLRDALSVLTPDQQASAFEMMSHRQGGMRGPGGRGMRGGQGMRRGFGDRQGPGAGMGRGGPQGQNMRPGDSGLRQGPPNGADTNGGRVRQPAPRPRTPESAPPEP